MSEKRPEDEKPLDVARGLDPVERPIDAKLVEEEIARASGAGPAPVHAELRPPETVPSYAARRGRKKRSAAGKAVFFLGLLLVAGLSIAFRKELAEGYDRLVLALFGPGPKEGVIEAVREEPEHEVTPKPRPRPKVQPLSADNVEEQPLPHFEPVTRPPLPAEEPLPPPKPREHYPGLAYSVIERTDLSMKGVFEYEMKVVVPASYQKDDLVRMASDVVAGELKRGLCHALRLLCYRDKLKTSPEDAFAEVIWAPEGNFARASEAVRAGSDNNEYRVIMRNR